MQTSDEKNYKAVHMNNQPDSDEELQTTNDNNPKLVIEDLEEDKAYQKQSVPQNENNNTKQQQFEEKQQQQQQNNRIQPQKKQEQVYPFKSINDYEDINIKSKSEWAERAKNIQPNQYEKKGIVDIKEPVLFTVDKQEAKHGRSFFTSLFSVDYRYIYLQNGYIYILQLRKDKMHVKSINSMQRLFKVILREDQLLLCFFNAELDKNKPPKVKTYKFIKVKQQKEKFLMKLRVELNKIGMDYDFIK